MFNNYLLKVGTYTFPTKYIKYDTYSVTKNVQDLDSFRDANGKLHRNALSHVPVKVEFETIPMNNSQIEDLFNNLKLQYTNALERKSTCSVYIPEDNDYIEQDMYMTQPNPKIMFIDFANNLIQYEPMRLSFIGY